VDRGLPGPRLLPQYFEPVPGYALGICEDRVVASHHPCVIAVQFHLRNLLGKIGGTGIKELLIVLLDFCFPVHHLESGQKLDKSRIFRELCRDPAGIFLVVQFAALGDDGGRRRRKVLRTVLLRGAWQSRSDCYRNDGKQELPRRAHANRLQEINHKEATNIGRTLPNGKHSVNGFTSDMRLGPEEAKLITN
jgi:hypothetical protein